ncbi:chemotaxis protein CheW [Marinoscillum pacificum]|uniref:chemotaxis protein CheW n=1 Tax=Marinoscillum pacificum TaxID=392723 RepID=UPI0021583A87|nr:chemotaxis protein CheW [Marinoscillum pacificum]
MKHQPHDFQKASDTVRSYLSFKLDEEFFSIPVMKVLEILEVPKITKVPHSPDFLKGVINLRGAVLPVIDTRVKFGMTPTEFGINTSILVLSVQHEEDVLTVGILVDSVVEVFEIDDNEIKPSPSIGAKYKAEFIEGMINYEDQFMMLLDIDQIFSLIEIQNVLMNTEELHETSKENA